MQTIRTIQSALFHCLLDGGGGVRILYYKKLRTNNVRHMDRFCRTLVSFKLSVRSIVPLINTLDNYQICKLGILNVFIVQAPGLQSRSLEWQCGYIQGTLTEGKVQYS
jgi:hypothetical protein